MDLLTEATSTVPDARNVSEYAGSAGMNADERSVEFKCTIGRYIVARLVDA